jgi:hypothetical protein
MRKIIFTLVALFTGMGCFAQSDLATFNLKNGVTKCIGTIYDDPNPGASVELTFDAKGTLQTIGGQKATATSNYQVKRDVNGRIVSIGYMEGDSFNTATFTYDSKGRVSTIRTTWLNLDTDDTGLVSEASMMWAADGNLYQMDVWDEGGNCVNHMYEYTCRDEKDNWVVRIHRDSNDNECQETRSISYAVKR